MFGSKDRLEKKLRESGGKTAPAKITATSFSGWHEWSDHSFEIRSTRPVDAGIDGEAVTLEAPLCFEIRPGALRVRIAPRHAGVSPAAIAGTLRSAGPRRLLAVAAGHDA